METRPKRRRKTFWITQQTEDALNRYLNSNYTITNFYGAISQTINNAILTYCTTTTATNQTDPTNPKPTISEDEEEER